MASRTVETSSKPSFAKVAASAYMPQKPKESSNGKPSENLAEVSSTKQEPFVPATNSDSQKPHVATVILNQSAKDITNNDHHMPQTSVENLQARDQQLKADIKIAEGPRRVDGLLRAAHADDGSTQLSSDSSAKPPSLDDKSVTSGTTFALDEKESLRPDDSASVKATEEEDPFSPPESNPADSRVGSDHSNRNFCDQLREITSMGPIPNRGPPGAKLVQSSGQNPGPQILFNPSAAQAHPLSVQPLNFVGTAPDPVDPIPDEKLLEAVESPRDRLFVMKLEQDFIDFVKDKQESSLDLPQCNGFYRMLAHRLADYYLLGHALDSSINAVRIYRTPFCRIPRPLTGPSNPSTSTNTPPPNVMAPKIMRRGGGDSKRAPDSEPKSETQDKAASSGDGDNGIEKDSKPKVSRTREEKEIIYKQAKERIWGPDHTASDAAEKTSSSEEKDTSRSSSAAGKKKAKSKQRKNSDDGFELRSQYEPYYPPNYPINGFGASDGSTYCVYPTYNTISQQSSPTGNMQTFPYATGYPAMAQQAQLGSNGWQGQNFSNFSPNPDSQGYASVQDNAYNLNAAFQQMSFQPPGAYSSQQPSNYGPAYQDTITDMSRSASQQQSTGAWSPMPYQNPTQPSQTSYLSNQASFVNQVPHSHSPYPYGQLPQGVVNGKTPQNQHPVPGSFNRQQFNPQSQAFVPHHMVHQAPQFGMMPQMNPLVNNFSGFAAPQVTQRPNSGTSNASFGSIRVQQPSSMTQRQSLQSQASFPAPSPSTNRSSQSSNSGQPPTQNVQSTLAKWGAPASLPPKPPPTTAQSQLPKVNDGSSLPPHPYANGRVNGGSNGVLPSR